MSREAYVRAECVTMGHQNCTKVLESRDGRLQWVKTIHKVYGKIHIEYRK